MMIDTSSLKTMADMVCVFSDQVTVVPSEEYWEICAIDPAHVGMVRFRLNASVFGDGYAAGEPFSIDMAKFSTILKDMGARTDLTVDGTERIVMKSDNTTRRFAQLSLLDPPSVFPADRIQLDSFAIFDPLEVKPRIASLCAIDQKIAFDLSGDVMRFRAANDGEDMEVALDIIQCKSMMGEAFATYPADYIGRIFRVVPKGATLQISLNTNMPVLLKFTSDDYSAEFMVAPQIESD